MKRIDRLNEKIAAADREIEQARRYAEQIEREAEQRAAQAREELERIEALPDWSDAPVGTVVAVALTYGESRRPYIYVLYKPTPMYWVITGQGERYDSDQLNEFLTSRRRKVQDVQVIAELGTHDPLDSANVMVADLGALLNAVRNTPFPGTVPAENVPDGDRD